MQGTYALVEISILRIERGEVWNVVWSATQSVEDNNLHSTNMVNVEKCS